MSWVKMRFLLLGAVLALLVNCQVEENRSQTESSQESTPEIHLINKAGLEKLINQRNDRILLINVWATWCNPCREEFPDLVSLFDEYENRDVDIVGISVDYPDEIDSKILPFLQSQQVNFPVYLQNFEKQEDFINFLNTDWSGALPASFVYDTAGELKLFLLGKQSYEELVTAIESEL